MQIINVDLVPGKVMPILHASQFDKGRSLGVKLYNGGAVFELSGAEDLTAAVRKPDGNIVTETLTNAGGSLVEIITTEQMTACAGGSLCEIKIENAGDVIGTANFVLEVEKDPTDGGIESESEIDNLATQVAGLVASEVENQYDSANVIFDDEPTEGHGNGYTVKSEGIKRAVDNVQNAVNEVDDKADGNKTASGAIATFYTSLALPLQDCTIAINAVQESGTPTPSSPKAISGFTGANIHVADDETPHVIDNVTPITWQSEAGTVYGGSLDVTTGLLTVDRASVTLNGSETWNSKTGITNIFSYSDPSIKDWGGNLTAISKIMADTLPTISQTAMVNGTYGICNFSWGHQICVRVENISASADLKTYLTSNPLQAVYELTTPQTIQLTPTQISAIVGTNNVFTDTNGDTSVVYACSLKDYVGDLSQLTTTDKSSLVGAVNEAYSYKSGDTITLTKYFTPCVYDANRLRAIITLPKAVGACSFSCTYLEVYINSTDNVQTNNITNTKVETRTPNQLWVQFTGNFTNVSNNNAGIAVISGTITFT